VLKQSIEASKPKHRSIEAEASKHRSRSIEAEASKPKHRSIEASLESAILTLPYLSIEAEAKATLKSRLLAFPVLKPLISKFN
jgi:hypothetical protein